MNEVNNKSFLSQLDDLMRVTKKFFISMFPYFNRPKIEFGQKSWVNFFLMNIMNNKIIFSQT